MAMMMNVGILIIDIYDFDLLDGLKSLISSNIVKVRSASYFLFPILIFDLKKNSLVLMKFRELGKCYPVAPGNKLIFLLVKVVVYGSN